MGTRMCAVRRWGLGGRREAGNAHHPFTVELIVPRHQWWGPTRGIVFRNTEESHQPKRALHN